MAKVVAGTDLTLTIGSLQPCYVSLGGVGFTERSPIDTTCLNNVEFITKSPQKLKELADIAFTAFWLVGSDATYDDIEEEVNTNQALTLTIANVGTIVFWGYLASFDAGEAGVDAAVQGSGSIVITNTNASDVETGPVFSAA